MRKIARFIATGAYVGYSPLAPGTFGTVWGILIAYFTSPLSLTAQALVIFGVFLASVLTADIASKDAEIKDPGFIVCDEITGALAGFFLIPFTAFNAILVFLLFRFFDILKPYPIGLIDKGLGGGLGIVLDDLVAGVFTCVLAHLIIMVAF